MKANYIIGILTSVLLILSNPLFVHAQEYVSPLKPVETGRSPGVKVKLLDSAGQHKTYVLIFSKGDEVRSGITEFARKYNIQCAHYTAIGDALSASLGFYDYKRKMFKIIKIDTSEIASFAGNITVFNGKPAAHTHVSLATEDGVCHGGHLLELIVGPTLEVFVTVEPTPLYKKLSPEFGAGLVDLSLEQ